MRERAAKAESGFVLSAEDPHLETGLGLHEPEEFVTVGGFTNCARSNDLCALDTKLIGERRHPRQRAQRVLNGDLTQLSSLVEPRAQSRRGLHFIYDADRPGGRDICNRLPDRVRADV